MRFFTLAALVAGASATYTVTQTEQVTITSCGPSVTNCPAKTAGGYGGAPPPVSPVVVPTYTPSAAPKPVVNTTSTIWSTSVYTVTSCAPTVSNCPAGSVGYTTVVVPIGTTICPVTAATPTTVATQYQPTTKWGQTGGAPAGKPSSTGWYQSSSLKPSSSMPVYTGAASHAQAGSFVAGVGIFAAFFL